jgi:hypothetical protein
LIASAVYYGINGISGQLYARLHWHPAMVATTVGSLSDAADTAMGSFEYQTVMRPHRRMHVPIPPQSDTIIFESFSVLSKGHRLSRTSRLSPAGWN